MYYPDLGTECQVDRGEHVRAIGWLSKDQPFPTGAVPSVFISTLRDHIRTAWQPVRSAGVHFCEFCPQPRPGKGRAGGTGNVWIPSEGAVYVAPELVVHYIEAHKYRPPDEFIAAVMACPAQRSAEFHRLLGRFKSNVLWSNSFRLNKQNCPAINTFGHFNRLYRIFGYRFRPVTRVSSFNAPLTQP